MGRFRFMLAFRFHRPRAGAGWAASASCWHERANQSPPLWQKRTVAFLDAESVLKSRWPLSPLAMATPSGHLSRPFPSSSGKWRIRAVQTCTSRSQASHQAPAVRQSPCSCGCHEALAGQAVSRQGGQHPGMMAFRFHRPRAGAGWAASASCWHSASTAPELSLDGRLPCGNLCLIPGTM